MALALASGLLSGDLHLRTLVETFLGELLSVTSCSFAFLGNPEKGDDCFGLLCSGKKIPQIDWPRLLNLIWGAEKSRPEYLVLSREEIEAGPRFGMLADHFERGLCDVLVAIPVLKGSQLLAVACALGSVPPVNASALRSTLRARLESLAILVAPVMNVHSRSPESVAQEALANLPEGVLIADQTGTVTEVNEEFSRLTDLSPELLIGKNLLQDSPLPTDCEYLLARLLETGQSFEVTTNLGGYNQDNLSFADGDNAESGRFLRLRGAPYSPGSGVPSGLLLRAEDVTADVMARRESNRRERRYSQEIELAKRLQQDFFPENFQKKRIRVSTKLITAEELAGDFFNIINLGPNSIAVVIGDVVGRGIPGSLMAMSVHGMIANQAGALTPPMRVLERVSDALNHQVKTDYWFATCFYAKIHVTQLKVTYSRAGLEPPLWWHHDTDEVDFLEADGLPLGIFAGNQYETRQVALSEGDRLLLYTDGLTDATNVAGERFGHDRLVELFKRYSSLSSKNFLSLVEQTVLEFQGNRVLEDDIALALISVVPDSWTTLTIPPYSFPEVLEGLITELSMKGVDEDTKFKIRLSVDECVTNAFRHGHRCDERKPITVGYLIEAGKAIVKVRDCGQGFDFGLIPDPTLEENLMSDNGRGVFLTLKMMDEVTFNDVGNEITLVKYLH